MLDLSKQRLDYDKIAHQYDEPLRDHQLDPNLRQFLTDRASNPTPIRVLDLGCGTGKQLTSDSQILSDIQFVGLDLFLGMLQIAQKRGPDVCWLQGDSAHPPLAANSFDYITNQFSYHHVQQKEKVIQQIYRVLKPDGRFVLTNIDPWHMPDWFIYQFFPAAWELDVADFLPAEQLADWLKTVGFDRIKIGRQNNTTDMSLTEVYAYVSQRSRASELMAITDEAYSRGVKRVEQAITRLGEGSKIQSTFCFLTIIANKD